jgi:large subunit ribosomal protein L24e
MPVCSFCRSQYEFPRGTTVVLKDGAVRFYCSSKCRKNSEIGRKSKKVKWIKKATHIKDSAAKRKAEKAKR